MNPTIKTWAIALAMGLSASGAFAAATASDTAANYAGTWGTSAANLGSGFGAWGFTLNNANNPPYVGTYLDQTSYGNPDGVLSTGYSWGTYANGSPGNGSFAMTRPFTAGSSGSTSLYNQTFSVAIGSGGIGGSGAIAVNVGTAFSLSYNGSGSDNLLLSVDGGAATTLPVSFSDLAGGLQIALAVSGPLNSTTESYTLTLSPFAGGPAFYTGTGTFDSSSYNTSSFTFSDLNTSNDQFINNLSISPSTGAKVNPAFSGLTASQSAAYGSAVTLSGTVSAAGPIYPAMGETVTVTINGNAQTTTINDATGDFSLVYNLSTIPASAAPYTITYSYAGDASLNSASDTSTTLTVNWALAPTFTTLHSFTNSDGQNPVAGLTLSGNTLYGTTQFGGTAGGGAAFAVNTDGTGFTTLHSFMANTDGVWPEGALILSGNTLYGTANNGGPGGKGTVFGLNTDGTGFTTLHAFDAAYPDAYTPEGGLVLSGSTLYGTTTSGGTNSDEVGTVFAVNTDGTGYTVLHSFVDSDGNEPQAGLILSGNTLYGTATYGGTNDAGTVFTVNTDGTGFTLLHSFVYGSNAYPYAGLVLSGNTLYGTTAGIASISVYGGTSDPGTVFAVNTDGTGFRTLHTFSGYSQNYLGFQINSDGYRPFAGLVLSGNTLYGTASQGGTNGGGTIFKINTDGTGFTVLYTFSGGFDPNTRTINSDGVRPLGTLILSGNTLYGTAWFGGPNGSDAGTVFALTLPVVSLTNIIVSPAAPIIAVSSNQQFTATGYFSDGSSQNVTSNLLWSSSNTNVASINTTGVATGLTNGVTTITAASGSVSNIAILTVVSPPAISTQSTNGTVSPNGSVTLSVGATGGDLSYQWLLNGTNLNGATGASLTITNFSSVNVGVYTVIVSNAAGSVTSQSITLASVSIEMFAGVIVNGPLGSNYVIQATSNLLNSWTTLTNVALPTQPYIYIDYSSPTNPQQFYRAVPQ